MRQRQAAPGAGLLAASPSHALLVLGDEGGGRDEEVDRCGTVARGEVRKEGKREGREEGKEEGREHQDYQWCS